MRLDPNSVRRVPTNPPPAPQQAALFVSGVLQAQGDRAEMQRLFDNEVSRHRAPMEIRVRELTPEGGMKWRTVMKRAV